MYVSRYPEGSWQHLLKHGAHPCHVLLRCACLFLLGQSTGLGGCVMDLEGVLGSTGTEIDLDYDACGHGPVVDKEHEILTVV